MNALIPSPELVQWLANGQRGSSSETMVEYLTGIKATGAWGFSHPYDPADLWRCRLLLEQVPEVKGRIKEMASCSPAWARLVSKWDALCEQMDEEAPEWRWGRGNAPLTYKMMNGGPSP